MGNDHAPDFAMVAKPEITVSPDKKWLERYTAWREAGEPPGAKFYLGYNELSAVWGASDIPDFRMVSLLQTAGLMIIEY